MPRTPRPWFRFYSEATESQKVHELPDRLVKPWLFMLCMANVNEPRGRLPSFSKIAFKMRVKEDKVKAWVSALVERRFLDVEGPHYVMHEWDDFQKDKDLPSSADDPAESGRLGNHKRWHVDRGVIAPDCDYCIGANRGDASGRIAEREGDQEESETEEKDGEREAIPLAPAFPFALAYVQHWQQSHAGDRCSPIRHGEMVALEKEHGSDRCLQAAEERGWDKPAKYYREWLLDPNNTKEARSNGRSKALVGASGRGPRSVLTDDDLDDLERYKRGEVN